MNTVQAEWETYLAQVVPPKACQAQKDETELAFYSGALILFTMFTDITKKGAGLSMEAQMQIMEGIDHELMAFLDKQREKYPLDKKL